ncbi:phage holin, lambda family, partial [Yersinia enterocolitica]
SKNSVPEWITAAGYSLHNSIRTRHSPGLISPMGRQDMKMHNSPDVWTLIAAWVAEHRGELLSALVAAIMALLRGWYAGGGRTQRMLDAAMCSIIAWFLKDIFVLLSIDQGWAMVSSVFIGYLGTDYIGSVLKRIVGNKTGAGNANQ